ncbi:MAG: hypothetical protein ABGY24_04090 [bacterium]
MARARPRMNIAAPLAPQGTRGLYAWSACTRLKRASLAAAAMGLAVSLFALFTLTGLAGLWSAQGPASGHRVQAGCVVPYSDGDSVYGRCDQSCAREDDGGRGGGGERGGGGRQAAERLWARVVDLGRRKADAAEPYWVAVVGDSIARNTLIALMKVSGVDMDTVTFARHQDFARLDPATNLRWTLHWAPFPRNATGVVSAWVAESTAGHGKKSTGKSATMRWPDAVVVSTSLWHVLWEHDVDAYREDVRGLVQALGDFGDVGSPAAPVLLNGPRVFGELLQDEQKRRYMVEDRIVAYNAALEQEVCGGSTRGDGAGGAGDGARGPSRRARRLKLVDVFRVTAGCGAGCSVDGIHSREHVYGERVVPMVLDGFGA